MKITTHQLRITVPLSKEDFIRLRNRAELELRLPREQAAYMLSLALSASTTDPADIQAAFERGFIAGWEARKKLDENDKADQ